MIHVAPTVQIESAGSASGDTVSLTAVVTQPGVSETETVAWVLTQNGTVIATGTGVDFSFADASPRDSLIAIGHRHG